MIDLSERIAGGLLGVAAGDALGATLEFMRPNEIRDKHGVHR
ncbi:MAG: ADP-ribosylglycohydrolase family protein, partial [bacterium]|nr:ADP-ribosylglycohydrolase family protein [bacterium]